MPEPKKLPAAFYQTPSGNEPVRDWLLGLDEGSRRIVGRKTPGPDLKTARRRAGGDYIMMKTKGRVGSSFEDYLAAQGILEETNAIAIKRVLAWQLRQAMEERQMSKSAMANAMRTSRSQLDRILDPENDHIRLDTLGAAARAVGLNLKIELVG